MSFKQLITIHRQEQKIILCMMLAAMLLLTTGFTRTSNPTALHQVSIHVDGKTLTEDTTHTNPQLILARAGVELGEKDEYYLHKIDDKTSEITVYRAVPITVQYKNEKRTFLTSKQTVGDALRDLGYHLEDIETAGGFDAPIHENMTIQMSDSAAVLAAQQQAQQAEMARQQPQVSGMPYRAVYSMEATAYLPSDGGGSGITATGLPAQRGVVAVDPNVIPLGSRVYIPGYGEAIAADTGGAIVGNRIDVCMESYGEAMEFGRREVEVYLLN
ncbi:MAG: 3D domain-containing protein [Selenomonadaceae bacterium]|nr:3D domain-containing protein [Selenomonadaceae bacterium]MDY2685306.1 3D domain-containing protein [Selenomonadaceae bacterium]